MHTPHKNEEKNCKHKKLTQIESLNYKSTYFIIFLLVALGKGFFNYDYFWNFLKNQEK